MAEDRWQRFYESYDYDRCAYLDGEAMAEYLADFFEVVGTPASLLSVGCGPAVTEFAIARRYPDVEVLGVDVAPKVVNDNTDLAAEADLDNITFQVGSLPDLELDRRFDLVYCVATLYFVAEVERALRTLYDHVADGGSLVVNYPTEKLQAEIREDSEWKQSFFELVLDGTNLLTAADVERVLGTSVEPYGPLVGAADLPATVYAQRDQ